MGHRGERGSYCRLGEQGVQRRVGSPCSGFVLPRLPWEGSAQEAAGLGTGNPVMG